MFSQPILFGMSLRVIIPLILAGYVLFTFYQMIKISPNDEEKVEPCSTCGQLPIKDTTQTEEKIK